MENLMKTLSLTKKEKQALEKLPVVALVLFGSQARGTAGSLSDYDFGVLPTLRLSPEKRKEVYNTLYDLLSAKIQRFVNIDIVFLPEASMELQASAAGFGIPLYQRNPQAFPRFRERTMDLFADFEPLRKMFQKATLARIP